MFKSDLLHATMFTPYVGTYRYKDFHYGTNKYTNTRVVRAKARIRKRKEK